MFSRVKQNGFIPVLQSFGASPLEMWHIKVENGCVRRVTDEQVRALALELSGTNVSTCYVCCPKESRASLGIHMPFLVMIIKSLKRYFTFEITVRDDRNQNRRFRMSNFEKANRIGHFCTSMPLCLSPGWNEVYFDLADLTRKAYKTNYLEAVRIQINANCRVRVIYFCDRIYEDKDIPQKLKIFLPTSHGGRRKSDEDVPEKKESAMTTGINYEDESRAYEEDYEAMYHGASQMEVSEQRVPDIVSLGKSASVLGEGDYEDDDRSIGRVEDYPEIKEKAEELDEVKQEAPDDEHGETAESEQKSDD
ncbi:hypothetical protein QAD02_022071 [Eretmocerus hayati]|uniref:Uncharacterized protein n=1 Tax=Eretmocerus hayati TaxID=131215 RepID=A0ACC2PV79_9HYME|nr:hypothetical protein QAD02_022071 [Eretmocerus hayati]